MRRKQWQACVPRWSVGLRWASGPRPVLGVSLRTWLCPPVAGREEPTRTTKAQPRIRDTWFEGLAGRLALPRCNGSSGAPPATGAGRGSERGSRVWLPCSAPLALLWLPSRFFLPAPPNTYGASVCAPGRQTFSCFAPGRARSASRLCAISSGRWCLVCRGTFAEEVQAQKLTAPRGLPGRSPTPVLTGPCAA